MALRSHDLTGGDGNDALLLRSAGEVSRLVQGLIRRFLDRQSFWHAVVAELDLKSIMCSDSVCWTHHPTLTKSRALTPIDDLPAFLMDQTLASSHPSLDALPQTFSDMTNYLAAIAKSLDTAFEQERCLAASFHKNIRAVVSHDSLYSDDLAAAAAAVTAADRAAGAARAAEAAAMARAGASDAKAVAAEHAAQMLVVGCEVEVRRSITLAERDARRHITHFRREVVGVAADAVVALMTAKAREGAASRAVTTALRECDASIEKQLSTCVAWLEKCEVLCRAELSECERVAFLHSFSAAGSATVAVVAAARAALPQARMTAVEVLQSPLRGLDTVPSLVGGVRSEVAMPSSQGCRDGPRALLCGADVAAAHKLLASVGMRLGASALQHHDPVIPRPGVSARAGVAGERRKGVRLVGAAGAVAAAGLCAGDYVVGLNGTPTPTLPALLQCVSLLICETKALHASHDRKGGCAAPVSMTFVYERASATPHHKNARNISGRKRTDPRDVLLSSCNVRMPVADLIDIV